MPKPEVYQTGEEELFRLIRYRYYIGHFLMRSDWFFQWQYDEMVGCKRGLKSIQRRHGHLRSRPKCSVKENPRAWWVYAKGRLVRPQPTWETSRVKAKENVEYVNMYTKFLTSPSAPLLPDTKAFKDKVEWDRSFEELRILREVGFTDGQCIKDVGKITCRRLLNLYVLCTYTI